MSDGSSYAGARDGAGNVTMTTSITAGQSNTGGAYYVLRGFFEFPIPGLSSVSICTLYLNGGFTDVAVDYEIYIHGAAEYAGTLENAAFTKFDGRQTGAAHDGTILNETWDTSSYSTNWNTIVFNAAGIDSVEVAQGNTLYIALISSDDFDNSAIAENTFNRVNFDSSADSGKEPYLSLVCTNFANVMGVTIPLNILGVPLANVKNFLGVE